MTTAHKLLRQNRLQAAALSECRCLDTLALIDRHAATFRNIIEGYESEFSRDPTVAELLWCASEVAKHDIRMEE